MTKSEDVKKFSFIAAICYIVYSLYDIYVSQSLYLTIRAVDIIFWIATLSMAVTLFMKNKKAVVAATGVIALFRACLIIRYFKLHDISGFVAYAIAVVLIIISIKGNSLAKKIWFVPACVMLLEFVVICIRFFSVLDGLWELLVREIIEIVGLLFVGLWIKEDATPVEAAPINEYSTFNPQAVYSTPAASSTVGGANKLKMYKDLLDSGIITQEEFDAKKKEILGL